MSELTEIKLKGSFEYVSLGVSLSKRCVTQSVHLLCTVFEIVHWRSLLPAGVFFDTPVNTSEVCLIALKHYQKPNYFMYSSEMETIQTNLSSSFNCWMFYLFLEVGVCLSSQFMVTTSVLKENETNYFAVVEQCDSLHWFILSSFKIKKLLLA